MNLDDSYRELGLTAESSDAEVKAAWRRLAARWHPDRNSSPQALRKIQRINRALEEIRRFRASSFGSLSEDGPASEYGTASQAPEPDEYTQRTLHHTLQLSVEEAFAGCIRDIHGEVVDDCVACGASGLQKHPRECADCGGTGRVRQHLWFAWMGAQVECPACKGRGATRQACGACGGSGRARASSYRCRARIPAGVRDGDLLHVPAQLQAVHGPEKVALSVRVELAPHEFFAVEADGTVKCEVPVDGFAWVANRWIEVPTPSGPQQMRLKRGYHTYRIKGHGFPLDAGEERRADCIVTVVPLFPEEFSRQQDGAIERLIASNSKAAGTAAGRRITAWEQALAKWRERVGPKPKEPPRR